MEGGWNDVDLLIIITILARLNSISKYSQMGYFLSGTDKRATFYQKLSTPLLFFSKIRNSQVDNYIIKKNRIFSLKMISLPFR